jgi:hypothetical protein
MKIFYLDPQHPDLSIENEILAGTGFELVPCEVKDEDEVIKVAQSAAALLTVQVPIPRGS